MTNENANEVSLLTYREESDDKKNILKNYRFETFKRKQLFTKPSIFFRKKRFFFKKIL